MPIGLHWGCGPRVQPGWVNSDIQPWPGVDVVADIRKGLPFPDAHFEYAVSIHALPELSYPELTPALRELARVLRPGGVLRLGLPDMDKAIKAYHENDLDYFLIPDDEICDQAGKMIVQLTWYGMSRSMYTLSFTRELLLRSGFSEVQECGFRETRTNFPGLLAMDNRPLESFFVEAVK